MGRIAKFEKISLVEKKYLMENNKEITQIMKGDQKDRSLYFANEISEQSLFVNDMARLKRLYEILEAGEIITAEDHRNAAIVFHHGRSENNDRSLDASNKAVALMKKAIALNPDMHKWLLAAIIDRNLMIQGKPQIYGTQYTRKDEQSPWEFYTLDSSQISDAERIVFGVETLEEQKEKLVQMNKRLLLDKYAEDNDLESVLNYCKANVGKDSPYDLSWKGISQFGFQLKRLDKLKEAVKVFEMNVELYPNAYDVFHTLGLEYADLNKKEEAIALLERSIELNPNFKEGKKDLENLRC